MEDYFIMKLLSDEMGYKCPLFVDFDLSKACMPDFFCIVLKDNFVKTETSSIWTQGVFLLNFINVDGYADMNTGHLAKFLDLSNLPVDHLPKNDKNKGDLGLVKSKTTEMSFVEVVCIDP